jgi:hypothetical protein
MRSGSSPASSSAGSACPAAAGRLASARSSSPTRCCPSVKQVVYGVEFKRVFKSKLVLGIADGWLEADGKRIYTVSDMRVGLFKPESA